MIVGIAGRYSAPSAQERAANLAVLTTAAAEVLRRGHIPLIGLHAALPVVEAAQPDDPYEAIMSISLAVMDACEGLLLLSESPGALRERDRMLARGLPVFYSPEELPAVQS